MTEDAVRSLPVRQRLQQAALDLFRERGFEKTTAADVAARAGVTERTFFRTFADKRETLFGGEEVLREALIRAIAEVASELPLLDRLFEAFQRVVPLLEGNRAFARPRQALIAATPALRERELAKHHALAEALANALAVHGGDRMSARLASQIAMMTFTDVTIQWLEQPEPALSERLEEGRQRLRSLLG